MNSTKLTASEKVLTIKRSKEKVSFTPRFSIVFLENNKKGSESERVKTFYDASETLVKQIKEDYAKNFAIVRFNSELLAVSDQEYKALKAEKIIESDVTVYTKEKNGFIYYDEKE